MKNIAQISSHEIIKHQGDLTIEGDIEEGATLLVEDGHVIIKGSVKNKVEIKVSLSDTYKKKIVQSVMWL